MPYIELSPTALRIILYGDETLEGFASHSKAPSDTAKVKLLPRYLGKIIAEADPEEELFHVEFAENNNYGWSEIWLAFEWKESNARRARQQHASHEARILALRTSSRIAEIKAKLASKGLTDPNYTEMLSKQILSNWKANQAKAILDLLDLAEMLSRFEEEDKQ